MWVLDDWHDWWRLFNLLFCATCIYFLFFKFHKNHWSWSKGTNRAWYALFTWCFTGFSSSIEGILMDTPYGFRLLMIGVGAAATVAVLRTDLFDESRDTHVH